MLLVCSFCCIAGCFAVLGVIMVLLLRMGKKEASEERNIGEGKGFGGRCLCVDVYVAVVG